MTTQPPELQNLLGSYARAVATAFEGVQVLTTRMLEAFETGDQALARDIAEALDQNVAHWRNTFKL
jgi:hypothetical protein